MNAHAPEIKRVAELLKKAKSVLFITGAGISADSGLFTYRGIGGLYEGGRTDEGVSIEIALSGEMLVKDPSITWKYLAQIENNCRHAKYNRAHAVIAAMEKHFERVWVLTQNIDGFHHAAGSRNVIDIHGNLYRLVCTKCGWKGIVRDYGGIKIPPKCPTCQEIARPDVVFFGEMLPQDKVWLLSQEVHKGFDIYFSIGTTSVFPYIQQPIYHAKDHGRPTVEINPGRTEVSHLVDIKLPLGAAEAMDAIYKEYQVSSLN